jgi:hypothetical protein
MSACGDGYPPARYVLSTRHGELGRALSILASIEAEELPSPTDFTMSIHHALLGLLSIHCDNRLGHTALSAGADSFAAGLLEAAACIAERPEEPVMLVHADEPLPAPYDVFREEDDAALPLVMALLLGPADAGTEPALSLEPLSIRVNAPPTASLADDFLRFYLSGATSKHAVGRRMQWVWRRDA